jgi:RNA polymerase sigma factor (sigma-70 family)
MYAVAKKILQDDIWVEDALQNAFMGIAKQIKRIQEFTPDETRAYVLTVAKNAACKLYNERCKDTEWLISIEEIPAQSDPKDPVKEVITRDHASAVLGVVQTLPPIYRDILTFRYVYNMQVNEIADALGKNKGAVRQYMTRASQSLKAACKKEGIILED